jgi:hypothetical protein
MTGLEIAARLAVLLIFAASTDQSHSGGPTQAYGGSSRPRVVAQWGSLASSRLVPKAKVVLSNVGVAQVQGFLCASSVRVP